MEEAAKPTNNRQTVVKLGHLSMSSGSNQWLGFTWPSLLSNYKKKGVDSLGLQKPHTPEENGRKPLWALSKSKADMSTSHMGELLLPEKIAWYAQARSRN